MPIARSSAMQSASMDFCSVSYRTHYQHKCHVLVCGITDLTLGFSG